MALGTRPPASASWVVDLARIVGAHNVSNQDADRMAYARDGWVRDRIDGTGAPPAAVVWPESAADVSRVLRWCRDQGVSVVPWGSGQNRCGACRPTQGGVVVDVKRLRSVRRMDPESLRCEVEAGTSGPRLEAYLNRQGFTSGHDVRGGTVGGFVATRSGGTFAGRYGKAEDLTLGLEVATPGRVRRLFGGPRPFDFPDFNAFFAGSEGTLGIVTSAELRIRPLPSSRQFATFRFAQLEEGLEAVRAIARAGVQPTVARLHDPVSSWLVRQGAPGEGERWLERWLEGELSSRWGTGWIRRATRGALSTPSMVNRALEALSSDVVLMLVFEGSAGMATAERRHAESVCLEHGGSRADTEWAESWFSARHVTDFAQARLLTSGFVVDRLESMTTWDRVLPLVRSVRRVLAREAVVTVHLSEPRPQGVAVHFTFGLRVSQPEARKERYDQLWRHALHAVHEAGGVIGLDGGLGELRRPLLEREHGLGGMRVLRALKTSVDPDGLLNPGKLVDPDKLRTERRFSIEAGLPHQIAAAVGEKNLYVRGHRTIVRPPDETALAALLRVARPRRVPVSSDQTGFRPRLGAVHIDMSRFEGVRRLSERALFVEVEAGVVVRRLEALLATHGHTLGPVHPRAYGRSVGSGLSRNLLVRRGTAFGDLKDLCIGVRGLLADGTPMETRTTPAASTGPQLDRALVGGHGRLGIITKAMLRIVPMPAAECELAFGFEGWSEALMAGRRVLQRGIRPSAARIFWMEGRVALVLKLVGASDELLDAARAVVQSAVVAGGGSRWDLAPGTAEQGRFDAVVEATVRWGAAEALQRQLGEQVGEAWVDFLTPEGATVVVRLEDGQTRKRAGELAVAHEGRVVAGLRSFSPIDRESYSVSTEATWRGIPREEAESGPYRDLMDALAHQLDPGEVLSARVSS